jgi:hypothetical protein
LEDFERLRGASRIGQRNADRVLRIGILAVGDGFQDLQAIAGPPRFAENQGQAYSHRLRSETLFNGRLKHGCRLEVSAFDLQKIGYEIVSFRHRRTFLEDLAREGSRLCGLSPLKQVNDPMDLRIDRDQGLRIVADRVGSMVACGSGQVAQREQAPSLFAARGSRRCSRGRHRESTLELPKKIQSIAGEIPLLFRIVLQVVELWNRQIHVLESSGDHSGQRGPAAIQRGRQRFEVQEISFVGGGRRQERMTGQLGGKWHPDEIEHGRKDVHMTSRPCRPSRVDAARAPEQERNPQSGFVSEESMGQLAVVAQGFPVVSGHDHQRPTFPLFADQAQERLQRRIRRGDLPEIGIARIALREGGGGAVGCVRFVQVDPEESLFPPRLLEPPAAQIHDLGPGPLLQLEIVASVDRRISVIVEIEAAIQTEARVERKGGYDRCRRVAPLREERRERRETRIEVEPGILPYAVLIGVEARQDVGVGRQRDDVGGVGEIEDERLASQRVEIGRLHFPIAVESQSVGSKGVDRDEDDVERLRRARTLTWRGPSLGQDSPAQKDGAGSRGQSGERENEPEPASALPPAVGEPHFRAWSISLTSFASGPLGASSRYFWKSAFASAFFFAWMLARPR